MGELLFPDSVRVERRRDTSPSRSRSPTLRVSTVRDTKAKKSFTYVSRGILYGSMNCTNGLISRSSEMLS